MELQFCLMLITNIVTSINAFILFSLLFFRKENPLPNKLLAFIFLIPGLYFIDNIFILNGYIHQIPFCFFLVQIIAIAYPIVVYAYVHILLGRKPIPNPILLMGSILLFCYIMYLTFHFYTLPVESQINYLSSLTSTDYPEDMMLYTSAFYVWQMVYFTVFSYSVYRQSSSLLHLTANTESVYILYIKQFVGLLWFLNLVLVILYLSLPIYQVDYFFLPICVSIIYLFILYISYHHNSVFTQHSFGHLIEATRDLEDDLPSFPKESDAKKPTEKHLLIFERLQIALDSEKEFQNPDLTLKLLSEKIGHPSYLVSQTINSFYQKSFFDLINERRIVASIERLKNFSERDTIESIAYEVGFNSRAAFYRAYKKHTGETPKAQLFMGKTI